MIDAHMVPVPNQQVVGKLEHSLGLEVFVTSTPGISGKMRQVLEDFQVIELWDQDTPVTELASKNALMETDILTGTSPQKGNFWFFTVQKWGMDTFGAIHQLARLLHTNQRRLSYCGIKDKKAITIQLISFQSTHPPIELFKLEDPRLKLSGIWSSPKPVGLGSHWGNRFIIKICNPVITGSALENELKQAKQQILDFHGLANFFGHQRFGVQRPITHHIGRFLIQNDFEGAIKALVSKWTLEEGKDAREARQRIQQDWAPKDALGYFPSRLHIERKILEFLHNYPGKYCQAFTVLPPQLRKMYIHGIQSYLFNRFLSERLRLSLPFSVPIEGDLVASIDERGLPMKILTKISSRNLQSACNAIKQGRAAVVGPLIGHHAEIPDNEWGERIRHLLQEEKISLEMFTVPGCNDFASAGTTRRLITPLKKFEYTIQQNSQKPPTITMLFDLQKGSYATVVLREIMKTTPNHYV